MTDTETVSDNDKQQAVHGYLTKEADFMRGLDECVEDLNKILGNIAKGRDGGVDENKTYVSKEDYRNIFGMDDNLIKQWAFYAENIYGKAQLTQNMPEKSVLKQGKPQNKPTNK